MFIGMIWRPTVDRHRPFMIANEFWNQLGTIRYFDSGHEIFNRAASRNLAVQAAAAAGETKLVITDADTIPDHHAVTEAWRTADDTAVHLPYTSCQVLDVDDTVMGEFSFTCGGVYITTINAWNAVGGQDERFTKWAPEDFAFKMAHETLAGPMIRHNGVLLSLGHNRDQHRHDDTETDPLVQLYRSYEHANGHPEQMRELCFPS